MRAVLLLLSLGVLMFCGCAKHMDQSWRDEQVLSGDGDFVAFNEACDQSDFPRALTAAESLSGRLPKNGAAWNCLGYVLEKSDRLDEALKAYERAVKVNPDHAKAWFNQGVIHGRAGRFKLEVKCYKRAVDLRPRYGKAWKNLSLAYAQLKNYELAQAAYDRAVFVDASQAVSFFKNPPQVESAADSFNFNPIKRELRGTAPGVFLKLHDPAWLLECAADVEAMDRPLLRWLDGWSSAQVKPLTSEQEATRIGRWIRLGLKAEKDQRWDTAILCYRFALKSQPDEASIWNSLGIAQAGAGRFDEALASFDTAVRLSGKDSPYRGNAATVFFVQAEKCVVEKRELDAIQSLQRGLEVDRENVDARFKLIALLKRNNLWIEARTQYKIMAEQFPKSSEVWQGMAVACSLTGEEVKVSGALANALRYKPGSADLWHWYGIEEARLNHWTQAAAAMERCVQVKPDDAVSWYHFGCILSRGERWSSSAVAFEKALALHDEPKYRNALGSALRAAGELERSIAVYQKSIDMDPLQPETLAALAECYQESRIWDAAAKTYRKLLELQPKEGAAWAALGHNLSQLGNLPEARDAYLQALREGASEVDVLNNLGIIFSRLTDYQHAVGALTKASQLSKSDPGIMSNLIIVHHRMGSEVKAQRLQLQLQKLDPARAAEIARYLEPRR